MDARRADARERVAAWAATSPGSRRSAGSTSTTTTTRGAGRSTSPGAFWQSIWDHFGVRSATPPGPALADARMPGARWFPGATLNYAEHALAMPGRSRRRRRRSSRARRRGTRRTSPRPSCGTPSRAAGPACVRLGVRRGDRVAAFLPNIPETVVGFLATASLGAIWSSCAPEFGTRAVVDRFAQIEPTVLLAIDGYRYGDKVVDRSSAVAEIRAALPTLRRHRRRALPPLRARGARRRARRRRVVRAARRARAARLRPRPVRPPAVRAVLARARPACPSRSSTATAASCSSTSRRSRCTRTSGPATGSAGSRRPAG